MNFWTRDAAPLPSCHPPRARPLLRFLPGPDSAVDVVTPNRPGVGANDGSAPRNFRSQKWQQLMRASACRLSSGGAEERHRKIGRRTLVLAKPYFRRLPEMTRTSMFMFVHIQQTSFNKRALSRQQQNIVFGRLDEDMLLFLCLLAELSILCNFTTHFRTFH